MEFDDILAICIEQLAKGESVESCLQRFPDEATQLEPLLRMAALMRDEPKPTLSSEGFRRGRQAVADAASAHKAYALVNGPSNSTMMLVEESAKRAEARSPRRERPLFAWPALAGAAIAACLVLVVMMVGVQSPRITPGSTLYDAKLRSERVQGLLMGAMGDEAQWHAQLADRRLTELLALQAEGQPVTAGQVERLTAEVDNALAASADLPEEARTILLSDLQRNLDAAALTLAVEGDALAALQETQAALRPGTAAQSIAVAQPTATTATLPTTEPQAEATEDTPALALAQPDAEPTNATVTGPGADTDSGDEPESAVASDEPSGTAAASAEPTAEEAAAAVASSSDTETPEPTSASQDALAVQPTSPAEQSEDVQAAAEDAAATEPVELAEQAADAEAPESSASLEDTAEDIAPSDSAPPVEPTPTWTPLPRATQGPALAAQPTTQPAATQDSADTDTDADVAVAAADAQQPDAESTTEPTTEPALAAADEPSTEEPSPAMMAILETEEAPTVALQAGTPASAEAEDATQTPASRQQSALAEATSTEEAGEVITAEEAASDTPSAGESAVEAVILEGAPDQTPDGQADENVQPEAVVTVDAESGEAETTESDVPPDSVTQAVTNDEDASFVQLPTATATMTPTATLAENVEATTSPADETPVRVQPAPTRRTQTATVDALLPTATPTRRPTNTPAPTATSTLTPTVTPRPTATPSFTPVVPPTATPTPEQPETVDIEVPDAAPTQSPTESTQEPAPLLPTPTPSAAVPPADTPPLLPTPTPAQ